MVGIIVIGHGRVAVEMVQTLESVLGPIEGLEAIATSYEDRPEEIRLVRKPQRQMPGVIGTAGAPRAEVEAQDQAPRREQQAPRERRAGVAAILRGAPPREAAEGTSQPSLECAGQGDEREADGGCRQSHAPRAPDVAPGPRCGFRPDENGEREEQ